MAPFCPNCGNKVEDTWNACPKCGAKMEKEIIDQPVIPAYSAPSTPVYTQPTPTQSQPYPQVYPQPYRPSSENTYGILSLIIGIAGLCICCFSIIIGLIAGVVALVLGIIGIKNEQGKEMAYIGLILGIIDIILAIIFIAIIIALIL